MHTRHGVSTDETLRHSRLNHSLITRWRWLEWKCPKHWNTNASSWMMMMPFVYMCLSTQSSCQTHPNNVFYCSGVSRLDTPMRAPGESPAHHPPCLLNANLDSSSASNLEDKHSAPNASLSPPYLPTATSLSLTNRSNPDNDHMGPSLIAMSLMTTTQIPPPTAHHHVSRQAQAALMTTTTQIPMPSHVNHPPPIAMSTTI